MEGADLMSRILIIEDELSIAELERDYLEINGYSVDMEHSGDKGLVRALNESYDLIILDVMLPKVDGFEICRKIRSRKDTPIIMISAKKEDIDKIRGLGLGADDYMIKPFSPGEMVARVKAHLARYERFIGNREQKHDEIRIRGLWIDKTSRRVHINEEEVSFTTKEFDLLSFLAVNPNRVFSKEQLFDHIWGMDSFGDISTVTVHIRKIREKVELDPSNPQYIETVWGAGYRFQL
jgi:DNA-binding response OmpR family regulator